tara:strand:+ start:597 stop:914 length:318 start_codon:yes stop_codon:yes gene_type:complete
MINVIYLDLLAGTPSSMNADKNTKSVTQDEVVSLIQKIRSFGFEATYELVDGGYVYSANNHLVERDAHRIRIHTLSDNPTADYKMLLNYVPTGGRLCTGTIEDIE